MYYTISTALLALSVGSALALNSSEIRRCGNVGLPPELLEVSKSMARETATAADRNLEVDAFFHVVATEAHSGWVTDQMLSDQVRQQIQICSYARSARLGNPKLRKSEKHHDP